MISKADLESFMTSLWLRIKKEFATSIVKRGGPSKGLGDSLSGFVKSTPLANSPGGTLLGPFLLNDAIKIFK